MCKLSFHSFIQLFSVSFGASKSAHSHEADTMMMLLLLLLLVSAVQVNSTAKLNVPKVLLPLTRSTKIYFPLETTDGCYRW